MLGDAYDWFCENGFHATTMNVIAERAGVAAQTQQRGCVGTIRSGLGVSPNADELEVDLPNAGIR